MTLGPGGSGAGLCRQGVQGSIPRPTRDRLTPEGAVEEPGQTGGGRLGRVDVGLLGQRGVGHVGAVQKVPRVRRHFPAADVPEIRQPVVRTGDVVGGQRRPPEVEPEEAERRRQRGQREFGGKFQFFF